MREGKWRNDESYNPDEDEMYASDHHATEENDNAQENEEREDDENDSADNPGDRTITIDRDQLPPSGYENTSSDNEGRRRRSWYGDGWDQTKPASTRSSSPTSPRPSAAPQTITQISVQRIPQPVPQAAPIVIMGIQPHWSQYADPLGDPQTPFCKAFAQGICTAGAACRFRHVLTPAEYTLLFHDQQPNLWTLPAVPSALPALAPPQLTIAPYSSPPTTNQVESPVNDTAPLVLASSALLQPPVSVPKKKPCDFYPLGKCRNGEFCPFAHTQHPVTAPTVQQSYSQDAPRRPPPDRYDSDFGHSSGPQRPRDKYDQPCKFYTDYGNCSRGPACRYRHGNESDVDRNRGGYRERRRERRPVDDAPSHEEPSKPDTEAQDNDGWGVSNESWANNSWEPQTNASDWLTPDPPTANATPAADEWPPVDDDNSPSAPWVVASVPCRYFAKGTCRKGADCPDRHDEAAPARRSRAVSEERPVESEAPQEEKAEEPSDTYEDGWGSGDKVGETAATDDPRSKQQCISFSSRGYCANMEDCPYMHGDNLESGDADQATPATKASHDFVLVIV